MGCARWYEFLICSTSTKSSKRLINWLTRCVMYKEFPSDKNKKKKKKKKDEKDGRND
jgi:hypothetical protein